MEHARRALAVIIAAAATSVSMPARAQDSAHDKAVATFQEGRKYIDQGNCDAAVTKLRESLSYEPSIGARLSLADCIESREPVHAWRMLKDAAAHAYVIHDDRLPVIEQRATELAKKLPSIVVTFPAGTLETPGLELRVDGEIIDRYVFKGGTIAVAAGRHLVEASAPGRRFSETVDASASAPALVTVLLHDEECARAPAGPVLAAPAPAAPPTSSRRTLGLALAGVGVAGIASGVVFGILTLNKRSAIESACGGNIGACAAPPGSLDADRDAATTTATISTASFISGAIALLGGGALYFTAPSTTTGKVRVTPAVARAGTGVGLEGSW